MNHHSNVAAFVRTLQNGSTQRSAECPDGLVDLSATLAPFYEIRLDPHRARTGSAGGVGHLMALILEAASQASSSEDESHDLTIVILVFWMAYLLRIIHDRFGVAPEEIVFEALKEGNLNMAKDDLAATPVSIDNGATTVRWDELKTFSQPLPLDDRHLEGLARRQLGFRTYSIDYLTHFGERLDLSEEDFEFIDEAEVEYDPTERDEYEWIADLIDQALRAIERERNDDDQ